MFQRMYTQDALAIVTANDLTLDMKLISINSSKTTSLMLFPFLA